jgi:hypothetical protein
MKQWDRRYINVNGKGGVGDWWGCRRADKKKHGFGVRRNINGDIITGDSYKVKYIPCYSY